MTNPSGPLPEFPKFPEFSVFGAQFTTWWLGLTGGWALAVVVAGVYLLISLVRLRTATDNPIRKADPS